MKGCNKGFSNWIFGRTCGNLGGNINLNLNLPGEYIPTVIDSNPCHSIINKNMYVFKQNTKNIIIFWKKDDVYFVSVELEKLAETIHKKKNNYNSNWIIDFFISISFKDFSTIFSDKTYGGLKSLDSKEFMLRWFFFFLYLLVDFLISVYIEN